MAPAAGLEGWANPPESILTLEESDKTFRALIYKACHILEIGLGDQWEQIIDVGFRAQSQIITADPRPEFALRWLLKKLQSPENYKNNPRFEWRAWILLRTLLLHTPISNSARLLKAQNLVTMLYESLQGLYDHCPKPQHLGNNEEWRLSDSSSDTVESSESKSRTSKKRRRDGTEAEGSHHLASVRKIETHKIFVAICGLLAQLQFFTVNQEPTQGYAKEHMKSSLKTKPEEAASILGNSLYLVNDILQAPYRSDSRRKTSLQKFENIACNFCVPSAIDFWVARSAGTPDSYDSTTNVSHANYTPYLHMLIVLYQRAFRLHCMLPALQLLDTVRQWPSPENGTETVTVSLEKLLINHVILPFRAITAGGEQRVKPKDGDLPPSLADELTPALKQFRFPWPTERSPTSKTSYDTERSSIKTQEYMIVTLLSLMFDVALACCPRHLSRLRRSDDPWLGELFSQLSECAKQLVPQTSTIRARKTCARLTRWMLEKAVDYQLQLSLPTIETTLEQTSGLLTEEHDVDWSIISLCLSIDANAFIIPASPVGSDQAPPYRPPNELLSALLSEVTNLCFRPTPNARPDNYDYVLSHVVIPLCTAFSNGRNLMGFLSYWKEQLNVVQLERSKQASTSTDSTLWEDQNLLQSAAHLLESTLTPGQIDQLISAAAQGLNHPPGKVLDRKPISLASLILLDCLFAGVTSDATMMQLAATAQSVFSSLEVIRSSDWCRLDRWRMWRIEGTIADRWFPVHNTREFKKAAHSALSGAIQMINDTVLTNWKSAKIDLSEALHAFTYILRFIAKEDSFWEDPHFLSRQHVLSAVRNIIDAMEPFCGRIRQDIFGTIKSPDIVPTWDELNPSKPVSIDTFYIGCVGCILELPYILELVALPSC